jgi:Protein of unknown function (DUF2934)
MEIQQSIAARAYQLFEERGQLDGHDLGDWFRAESKILLPISVKTYDFEDSLITRYKFRCREPTTSRSRLKSGGLLFATGVPLYVDSDDVRPLKRIFNPSPYRSPSIDRAPQYPLKSR